MSRSYRERYKNALLAQAGDDFVEDPVPDDFKVPDAVNPYNTQLDGILLLRELLRLVESGELRLTDLSIKSELNSSLRADYDGRMPDLSVLTNNPTFTATINCVPGPKLAFQPDDYPELPDTSGARVAAGTAPPRQLILDDDAEDNDGADK